MSPIWGLCVVVPLAWFLEAPAADEDASKHYIERCHWIMEEYKSGDFRAAQKRLWQEWGATDHALCAILRETDSDEIRRLVVRRLADMRSKQAVWGLIRHMTLPGPGIVDLQEPLSRYPAALALAKIGLPAVRMILRDWVRLPRTDEELALSAAVVRRHYVLESDVGRFHIQHLLQEAEKRVAGEDEPDRCFVTWRENLARLLEFYDAIDRGELFPGFGPPKRAGAEK